MKIIERALEFLKAREFISVATADKEGAPNSAPKFLLKTEGSTAYFIDYSMGTTAENLKVNPKVSLSFMDLDTLMGYKLNGTSEVIEKGKTHDDCLRELSERKIKLSVERIIKGVHNNKVHRDFELGLPERFLVYKVKIEEIVEIGPRGELRKDIS
jgi:uncharacterized pyridoxamine 5'-phosphate oxidase family protein